MDEKIRCDKCFGYCNLLEIVNFNKYKFCAVCIKFLLIDLNQLIKVNLSCENKSEFFYCGECDSCDILKKVSLFE
jgi:hypothetical protein